MKTDFQGLYVRIVVVLVIGWLLFAALHDTFTGRMPAFGPGNYGNVIGGLGRIYLLVSAEFLAFAVVIVLLFCLIAWLRDEYALFMAGMTRSKKHK